MIRYCLLVLALAAVPSAANALSCLVSTGPVNFGAVLQTETQPINITGNISVSCSGSTAGTTIGACIDIAAGIPNGSNQRQIANGGAELGMQLFQDSARSIPWGSFWTGQTPIFTCVATGTGSCTMQGAQGGAMTVYGRLYPSGSQVAGGYLGNFPVTVSYGEVTGGSPSCSTLK
jgi:spore coat protein U-like protein